MKRKISYNVLGDGVGFVKVVDVMGTDKSVTDSARISFAGGSDVFSEKDTKLVDYLAKNKHTSPFRHCFMSFRIKAPEFVMRQWYKHVIGCGWVDPEFHNHGWNEISGRYVEVAPEFYKPSKWRTQSKDNKQASSPDQEITYPEAAEKEYNDVLVSSYNSYRVMLNLGVAKEMARMMLPVSSYTEVVWTASLQALCNFVTLRDHPHAQFEIQEYARAISKMCEEHFPVAWAALRKHNVS